MADLREYDFDANQVDPTTGFDPLPNGKYLAIIVESELKPTKAGDGKFLLLVFEVLEGAHKGRKLWLRLNIQNKSEKAVEIARAELSAICRATGVMTPRDSCELHDVPISINVKCRKREDTDEIENVITKYESKDAVRGVPQQATSDAPPWQRR